ncbi:MAG TPA: multidrug ABC transporter ATP-binding protein [Cytophagales bacterium]|nr:multidrug ABC transporter ATP-binding protein [Cytophagales bacterium]HRG11109.1 ABC transporter transmembrane domain-containing protein [Cyclobacteriaceae bacterium]
MAKRNREEGEKRPLNKAGIKNFLGVFRFVLPYKWIFAIGLVALSLSSGVLLSFPYLSGKLLDVAQGKTDLYFNSINQVAFTMIAVLLIQGVFSFLRVYTFTYVSEHALADLRIQLYSKMIWLPLPFYDNRRVGELMSRITSDVSILYDTFTFTLAELLRQILMLVIGIPLLIVLYPELTVFMLLTFPVLIIAALFFGKFIRKLSKKTQDQLANANVVVEETLQSVMAVKAFTNEVFEINRYKNSLTDVIKTAIRASRYRGAFISFTIVALFGGIVAVGWYGALMVQKGEVQVGELFSFIIYTVFIGGSIAGLGDIYSQLQKSIGASERIIEILETADEKPGASTVLKLQGKIEFNNVQFAYPTRPDVQVLKALNISIKPGEKVALVGPSGSGKSTIINLLLQFYQPSSGTILIDDLIATNYNLHAYRSNLGVVPQEVILFGGTIRENIAYGKPGATAAEITDAARKANAWEFIESFPDGLDTVVGDRGVKLSGGQRQRVAIARAILRNPAILILDEATSSLDAHSEKLVQDALENLMQNRTTLVIAHRLSTIRKVDTILVIKEGIIAEAGNHAELSARDNGIYSNLLKLQVDVK